jgi:hypothetical protein
VKVNLTEIVAEIDEKYPSGYDTASKVRKIDKLQKKLYRTVVKNTIVTTYELLEDQPQYALGIHPSKIREVLVDGKMYEYKQIESQAASRFFYILKEGATYYIGLYPTPTTETELMIYHYEEPTTVSSADMTVSPDLDADFHDLFVYGICKELAENDRAFDIANGFTRMYQSELDKFIEANMDTEPAQIQEARW